MPFSILVIIKQSLTSKSQPCDCDWTISRLKAKSRRIRPKVRAKQAKRADDVLTFELFVSVCLFDRESRIEHREFCEVWASARFEICHIRRRESFAGLVRVQSEVAQQRQ